MTVKYNPPSSCILEISVKGIKLSVQEDYYACDRVRISYPCAPQIQHNSVRCHIVAYLQTVTSCLHVAANTACTQGKPGQNRMCVLKDFTSKYQFEHLQIILSILKSVISGL